MNLKIAIVLIALTVPLAGCGNKGALELARPPAPLQQPATPAGTVPVEVVPVPPAEPDAATEPLPADPVPPIDDQGG